MVKQKLTTNGQRSTIFSGKKSTPNRPATGKVLSVIYVMYLQFIPITQVRDKNNGSVFLPSEANRFDSIADGESVEHIIARIRNEKREEKKERG